MKSVKFSRNSEENKTKVNIFYKNLSPVSLLLLQGLDLVGGVLFNCEQSVFVPRILRGTIPIDVSRSTLGRESHCSHSSIFWNGGLEEFSHYLL